MTGRTLTRDLIRPGFSASWAGVCVLCLLVGLATGATAQTAGADSLKTSPADTNRYQPQKTAPPTRPAGGLSGISQQARDGVSFQEQAPATDGLGFWGRLTNEPKAGSKTDVRVNTWYTDWNTSLKMAEGSIFNNKLSWSWDDYRQQDRTAEKRSWLADYNAGTQLPVTLRVNSTWDWSEDRTLNAGGLTNLSKRDYKKGEVALNKVGLKTGIFTTSLSSHLGMNDQTAVNRDQPNDFSEAFVDGGAKVGARVADGVSLAARLFGRKTGGDRSLGQNTAPSNALADSVGAGFYYKRGLTNGLVSVTRSNFDRKYLDWRRNSTGQPDTSGRAEADKVVNELETKDALSIEFENTVRLGRVQLKSNLSRATDSMGFTQSLEGSRENYQDKADLALTFGVGRDSIAVSFGYLFKWDDQRIKNADTNRGKQTRRDRDVDIYWERRLFKATDLMVAWHTGLGQDMAENEFNNNDKDRVRTDLSVKLERNWPGTFRTNLLFAWSESQDIAIHATRSANNNVKPTYEVSPGYNWTLSDWITLAQTFRVYIQYTDYDFGYLEEVNKQDNYNKRGNMNTMLTFKPTRRLDIKVKHDFNKRFNATKTGTDAAGNSKYFKDQVQVINKIDLGFIFKVADGVTLEGATYRTRDDKEIRSSTIRETVTLQGEIWVGARVNRRWGQGDALELSAMVKKFNAYGPSISEAASDYWEADVWLAWEF